MSNLTYETVLHVVGQWPVERRAMLAHALIEGLKFSAEGRRPAVAGAGGEAAGAGAAAGAAGDAAGSLEEAWKEERIAEKYRR